jgi:hypothetical protein
MKTLLASILLVTACTSGDSKPDDVQPMAASDVQFDNASSGLASTNVQDALDDLIAMAQAQQEQMNASVIVCRYATNSVTVPSTGLFAHAFTPSECGGVLPDDRYVGSISRLDVCNLPTAFWVMSAGETDGPGAVIRMGSCSGKAEIKVVYTKTN